MAEDANGRRSRARYTRDIIQDRIRVVFAWDLPDCPDCGEPWCPAHSQHYADCPCLGPNQAEDEGYTLQEDPDGILWAIPTARLLLLAGLALALQGCAIFSGSWRYSVEAEGHVRLVIERVEPPQKLSPPQRDSF